MTRHPVADPYDQMVLGAVTASCHTHLMYDRISLVCAMEHYSNSFWEGDHGGGAC